MNKVFKMMYNKPTTLLKFTVILKDGKKITQDLASFYSSNQFFSWFKDDKEIINYAHKLIKNNLPKDTVTEGLIESISIDYKQTDIIFL